MSSEATRFVRDAVDVPSNLAGILLVLASYCDERGLGCSASAQTLGRGAKKQQRQAEKDLAALRKLGVIEPGDQGLVAHIHPDHRPVVYDLPGAAAWIAANPVDRRRPSVLQDGGTHRPTRRRTSVVPGSNPPSCGTDKTPPSGGETAPTSAQGSAQRPGAKDQTPPATHAFVDDGFGACGAPNCGLPAANARHQGATHGTALPNPAPLLPDLRGGKSGGTTGTPTEPGPADSDSRRNDSTPERAGTPGEIPTHHADGPGIRGLADSYEPRTLPGGRVITIPRWNSHREEAS